MPLSTMQDLEGQGTGCRAGRPVCPSRPHTPCSEGQLKCVGNEDFTDDLSRASNAGPSRCKAGALSTTPPQEEAPASPLCHGYGEATGQ